MEGFLEEMGLHLGLVNQWNSERWKTEGRASWPRETNWVEAQKRDPI